MTEGGTHPTYRHECYLADSCRARGPMVRIGDEVLSKATPDNPFGDPLGVVTDIHGESFGDGVGDTITVLPAAVTLSTGDRYPVADLVLTPAGRPVMVVAYWPDGRSAEYDTDDMASLATEIAGAERVTIDGVEIWGSAAAYLTAVDRADSRLRELGDL